MPDLRLGLLTGILCAIGWAGGVAAAEVWKAGVAKAVITPEKPLWLAGYGSARLAEGKRHDLWVKALALEDAQGQRGVVVTSDLVGLSKGMVERLGAAAQRRFGLARSQLFLTSTHNHCAPVTTAVLPDYYPLDDAQWQQVDEYSQWLAAGTTLPRNCPYTVQVWRFGADQLWIGLGAEAVVDYALRFKQAFGPETWVCGYAQDMVGYVPSRRVWAEGGYEGGNIYEYGWLAYRWTADTEDRVAASVQRLVSQVRR